MDIEALRLETGEAIRDDLESFPHGVEVIQSFLEAEVCLVAFGHGKRLLRLRRRIVVAVARLIGVDHAGLNYSYLNATIGPLSTPNIGNWRSLNCSSKMEVD